MDRVLSVLHLALPTLATPEVRHADFRI
jgi:hypothetical protein